jgi:acyl-coenzyme A synthetase/AMP-(fatty) acid ligase/pimeloyl-ACP methyl ester carboxylesterase
VSRTWHVLDNQVEEPTVTLLCVHGNPTWSYLWRDLLAEAPPNVRVIAIDQLDMGFSERTGTVRRLGQRIDDLAALTDELGVEGPVVTVAHDWGGPISLGWAQRHREQMAGIVLTNTAVHQPPDSLAPRLIRAVRFRWMLRLTCVTTPVFLRGALLLARPRLSRPIRRAYEAPYRGSDRRAAIGGFVDDIPLSDTHPSKRSLDEMAAGLGDLAEVPSLLLWGAVDPVFSGRYLSDLAARLPGSEIHRFGDAGHLLPEDKEVGAAVFSWLGRLEDSDEPPAGVQKRDPLWSALDRRADDDSPAVVDFESGAPVSMSFRQLAADVKRVAAGMADLGVEKGDRVALLVPPGIDLAVCVYACWRLGAVVVVADAGLGARGMSRALASADPAYLIGVPRAIVAARTLRWPGVRISTTAMSPGRKRLLGVLTSIVDVRRRGEDLPEPKTPTDDDFAGIGFTSGATGPAKGVAYRHSQLQAQRDVLIDLYGIVDTDRLVAAFGPFALFGPSMGITSVVPEMEVTSPGSLTASALARSVEAVAATLVFASPAALNNVVATSSEMSPDEADALKGVRLLMSAGAPVPAETLRAVGRLMPNAEPHTPYGMTEVLPVADITLAGIEEAGSGDGVCVGYPVPGVEVAISPLDAEGDATGSLIREGGVVGEVCVRADHMRDGYDKLWVTEEAASQPPGWHRSGDVGHLDDIGRLWIGGRMGHIVKTASGPVTPVGIEHAVGELSEVVHAAAVGIGPAGTQQVIVVVVPHLRPSRPDLADEDLADRVRARMNGVDVAAVLVVPSLPVDKRHNSKIDRTRISRWAEGVLSGDRMSNI